MSTSLSPLDLTGAVVGTTVTLDFNQFVKFNPARMQQKAHLGLFNESGCGLQCVMKASGDSQYLPAGGWTTFEVESNDSNMVATVTYILPNPPVSQLNAVYYAPGEEIPNGYTLGNSPIGIGGSVQTSSVQTLSNEGNAANTLVEDIGDVAFAQLFTLYTDGHCLWAVDQSGVKHQVIKIQTAGNPLQLGQAGDTSEVLGNLQVDGSLNMTPTPTNVAGTVSGSCDVYYIQKGTIKEILLNFKAMKTNNVDLALPVSFTKGAHVAMGDGINLQFMLAGVAQATNNMSSFNAVTPATNVLSPGIGDVLAGFDTLRFAGTGAATHSGWARIEGV